MEKKVISILSILIPIIFIAAIIYMVLGITVDSRNGAAKAQNQFNVFITETATICQNPQTAGGLYKHIQNAALTRPDFAMVSITDMGQNMLLTTNRMAASSSPFIKSFSSSVLEFSGRQITVTANIFTLTNADIFSRTRIAFLLVLAGTLTAGVLLVFIRLTEKGSPYPANAENTERPQDADTNAIRETAEPVPAEDNTPVNIKQHINEEEIKELLSPLEVEPDARITRYDMDISDTAPTLQEQDEQTELAEEGTRDMDGSDDDNAAGSSEEYFTVSVAENDAEENPEEITIQTDSTDPYATVSGFMGEQFLEPAVSAALEKAAAAEEDMSLLLIKISEIDYANETAQKIYSLMETYFKSHDNIFEYGDDCFAGILFGTDTDTAMVTAEKLTADIAATLNDFTDGVEHQICIGLSSRSFRSIASKRLLMEAAEALRRTEEDSDSPIIAFRVDPEKYKQYMANTMNRTSDTYRK